MALGIGSAATGTFGGVTVSGKAVLVKYTFAGDLNLDGQITGDDYGIIDPNTNSTPTHSSDGDVNYSGYIDADDGFYLDSNYGYASFYGPL